LVALEKFGDLARLVETDEYWEPLAPNVTEYNPDEDPHGFIKLQVNELLKDRVRVIERMKNNKANLYGFILSRLSNESMDEVKRHEDFNDFNSTKDPLELWLAVKQIHRVDTNSLVQEFRKNLSRALFFHSNQWTILPMDQHAVDQVNLENYKNKVLSIFLDLRTFGVPMAPLLIIFNLQMIHSQLIKERSCQQIHLKERIIGVVKIIVCSG